jgi:hypothetical protein
MSERRRKKVMQFPSCLAILWLTGSADGTDPVFDLKSLGKHIDAVRDGAVNVFGVVDQASPDLTCR